VFLTPLRAFEVRSFNWFSLLWTSCLQVHCYFLWLSAIFRVQVFVIFQGHWLSSI